MFLSVKNSYFLEDPFRIYLIKTHRKDINNAFQLEKSGSPIGKSTFKPPKNQRISHKSTELKEIFLNEIDFTKDHILNGFILNVTIIDIPNYYGYTSIFFIIEDKNKTVERTAVYNLGDDYEKIKKNYRIGTVLSIINPYIRMAADEKPMIRIDDTLSILIQNRKEKMCSYCGEGNSKYICAKCRNAFYCSKECQINDYKILDHKLICFT